MVEPAIITCPACGCNSFVPIEKDGVRLAKCVKCGKEIPEAELYKAHDCNDGACKI